MKEYILNIADAESIVLVLGGFFWCFFGIFLRKLHRASKEGKSFIQLFKETPNREIVLKIMVVLAAMRFFKIVFDTDQIAFAGFMIGLSLDILPDIIFGMPKYFTSKFNVETQAIPPEEPNDTEINQDLTININNSYNPEEKRTEKPKRL